MPHWRKNKAQQAWERYAQQTSIPAYKDGHITSNCWRLTRQGQEGIEQPGSIYTENTRSSAYFHSVLKYSEH